MRLPEDEPFYMRRNLQGAIERYVKHRTPEELTPEARAALVQQIAAQAPAITYMAAGQISLEGLAHRRGNCDASKGGHRGGGNWFYQQRADTPSARA